MAHNPGDVPIPSPGLHLTGQDVRTPQGPVSEVGTIDRIGSPGAESTISQMTQGPFAPPSAPPPPQPSTQLHPSHAASESLSRQRSNSNLSPPEQQAEWPGNTVGETLSRPRSNSATRYYTQARERSGTVNSANDPSPKPSYDHT
ncbi:MAG: hypothetical protein Q9159_007617, partial [Coniocarpon cinnabarinum]